MLSPEKKEKLQTLPSGGLEVKVICHKAGQLDMHILAICHLALLTASNKVRVGIWTSPELWVGICVKVATDCR